MGLTLPVPTVTPGPLYATQEVAAFTSIDAHDHTPTKGVPVPVSGLNINADFPFNSFNATLLRTARFDDLASPPALGTDLSALSSVNGDLYYNNGTGFPIQITAGSGLNATSIGGIGGDYATSPASVFYTQISALFTFWQNTNQSAKLDIGPVTIRNTTVSSFGVTLAPPAGLAASYGIVFPLSNPASTKLVGWDSTGNLLPVYSVDNSSIEFDGSNNLRVKALGVQTSMLALLSVDTAQLNTNAVTTVKITDQNVTAAKIVNNVALNGTASATTSMSSPIIGVGALTLTHYTNPGTQGLVSTGAVNGMFFPNGTANAALQSSGPNTMGALNVSTGAVAQLVVGTTNAIGSTMLRLLRGAVSAGGAVTGGEGFSVGHPATGIYVITYTTGFDGADSPIPLTTCNTPGFTAVVSASDASSVTVETRVADTPFAAADASFHFLTVGVR